MSERAPDPAAALAERARAGDASAFDGLVRAFGDRVYRMGIVLLGRREEARDLAQEVFLRAWRALPAWRPEAALSTWLYGIALNVSREFRRKSGREIPEGEAAPDPAAPAGLSAGERLGVLEAVARLPDRQREVVTLRFFEGLSTAEAAGTLGTPEGTVKSNLSKAMDNLRRILGEPPGPVGASTP